MTTIIHIGSSKALSTTVQSHMQTLDNDFFYFGINFDKQKFEKKGVGHSFLDEDCEKCSERNFIFSVFFVAPVSETLKKSLLS